MGGIQLVLTETEIIWRSSIEAFGVCALIIAAPLLLLAYSKKKIFEQEAASTIKESKKARGEQITAGSLLEEGIDAAGVYKESDPCVSWEKIFIVEGSYRKLRRDLSFLKELLAKSDKGKISLPKIGTSREEVIGLIAYLEKNFTSPKSR